MDEDIILQNSPTRTTAVGTLPRSNSFPPLQGNSTNTELRNSPIAQLKSPEIIENHIQQLSLNCAKSFTKLSFTIFNLETKISEYRKLINGGSFLFETFPPHLIKGISKKSFIDNPPAAKAYAIASVQHEITTIDDRIRTLKITKQRIYEDAISILKKFNTYEEKYPSNFSILSAFEQQFDFHKLKIQLEFTKNREATVEAQNKKRSLINKVKDDNNEIVHLTKANWTNIQLEIKNLKKQLQVFQQKDVINTKSSPSPSKKDQKLSKVAKGKPKNAKN